MTVDVKPFKPIVRWDKQITNEGLTDLWFDDAIHRGYIHKVLLQEDSLTWNIMEKQTVKQTFEEVLYKGRKNERIKVVEKDFKLFDGIKYTPDRTILWDKSAHGIFYRTLDDVSKNLFPNAYFIAYEHAGLILSWLDVKAPPSGGKIRNCSDVSFGLKSKLLWERAGIYVCKVYNMPTGKFNSIKKYLFLSTFVPNRFLWTDTGLSHRGFNKWTAIDIDSYVKNEYF